MSGIVAIQSRIAEIEATVQGLGAQSAATTSAAAKAKLLTSATSLSFADTLAASTQATLQSSTGTATSTAAGAGTGAALVAAAEKYLGVPYVWGGTNPATGLDCSGLVQRAMADLGVTVPRVARDQAKVGSAVTSMAQAKPGDLLVFDGGSHIAIYVGDGKMIDAPKPGKSVSIRAVYETPTSIRRVLPEAAAVNSTSASTISTTSTTTAADLDRYALTMMTEATAA